MKEQWKPIPSAPHYEASSLGCIRSWKSRNGRGLSANPRLMTPYVDRDGYRVVRVRTPVKGSTRKVCTLIAEAFLGPRPVGAVVRHLNGDSADDKAWNLMWGTQKENVSDARGHGTLTRGERIANSKLTAENVAEIRRSKMSVASIAAIFDVSESTIYRVIQGRTWAHVPQKGEV